MKIKPVFAATAALAMASALLVGCSTAPVSAPVVLNDSELKLPADYKSWPKFLSAVQRPDAKQVREIYMNPVAKSGGTAAAGFPNGSVFVMENYAVVENADGTPKTDASGKLVKGALVAVFVQGKNPGWGDKAIPELRNGNWIYAAYTPAGAKGPQDTNTCRACHLPLTSKDFVHRYDEYFGAQKTGAASGVSHGQVLAALANRHPVSALDLRQLGTIAP